MNLIFLPLKKLSKALSVYRLPSRSLPLIPVLPNEVCFQDIREEGNDPGGTKRLLG